MDVSGVVQRLKEFAKLVEVNYGYEIEKIIKLRVEDEERVETLLDLILDCCFDKAVIIIYKRLVKYYYGINEVAAISYINAYSELYE